LPADLQPPQEAIRQLQMLLVQNRQRHILLNRTLVEITDLLQKENIHPVLLKGQGVALNYIESALRQCGDIDLYIGTDDYQKACIVVDRWNGKDENSQESKKHYHLCHQGVNIELHRIAECMSMPWHNARFQRWTRQNLHGDNLRRVYINSTEINLPPFNFDVLYIFNHAWCHFIAGGISLRQLCDWARYLHTFRTEIDRDELKKNLKAFGLWHAWQLFGYIAVKYIGLPKEDCPFYTNWYSWQTERILDMIQKGGNFGFFQTHVKDRPDGYWAGKWFSFKKMHHHFYRLLPICPQNVFQAWIRFLYMGVYRI